jgi:hypothetical protein
MKRNFQDVLDMLQWPNVIRWDKLTTREQLTFKESLENLVLWQHPTSKTDALWFVSIMIEPLAIKFRYHFQGTRPTNRLDKVDDMRCDSL